MMWKTARELAGLPGMPSSERRTRDKLTLLGLSSRPRAGREGGGGMEYDCTALPTETRTALAHEQIATAGTTALMALTETAPAFVPPLPEPQPIQVPDHLPQRRRPPSVAEKSVADARVRLVQLVLDLVGLHGIKRACSMVALQLASGAATADLQATAKQANQRARDTAVSPRSLERWVGQYRAAGWWALLPAQPQELRVTEVDQDVAATLGLYHSRDARFRKLSLAAQEVTRTLGREFDTWKPLYSRARRTLEKLGTSSDANVRLIKARHSGSERDAKLPFKRRDASMLEPLDVFVIDGHTFKAKVRHPDHGAPFAPELTMVIDWSTRKIVGWSVALSENVLAVGDALRHAVSTHGVPAIVYSDNGGGETGRIIDCPVDGYMARLGTDHRTGIPGKPQARGVIERSWQVTAINCARQFGSYQGSDVDGGEFRKVAAELAKEQRAVRRAKETGEVIHLSPKAPTWAQFIDAIERMVQQYNAEHRHRSLPKRADGKHMTPDEAWAAKFNAELQHKPSQAELRELFMPGVLRTAKRGEVSLFNQIYAAPELMRRDVDGREVSVRYDIHDPTWVRIYTVDGEFVADAQWNANRIDAMPKAVVDMAREKRVKATIKRRELQIETALAELNPSISLPAPSAPVVLEPTVEAVVVSSSLSPSSTGDARQLASGRPSFFDAPSDRYEWLMRNTDAWEDGDRAWLGQYVAGEDYQELREYYAGRGLAWPDAQEGEGFRSAR